MKILSIDGGGIRGILPAIWLSRLNKVGSDFDLLAGTSTGSLIAAAMAIGIRPSVIAELYREQGRLIFPSFIRRIPGWIWRTFSQGISKPLYSNSALKSALMHVFSDYRMGDVQRLLLIPAFSSTEGRPVFFKSWHKDDQDLLLRDVCLASCSAPVYFPSARIQGREGRFIDGGLTGANNPTVSAIAEALHLGYALEDLDVLSVGTGSYPVQVEDEGGLGPAQWASKIITICLDGPQRTADYQAKAILKSYRRINAYIDPEHAAMDDGSDENIIRLSNLAFETSL